MKNKWLFIAGLSGFLCVAIGAFAAHGLSKVLEPKELAWIETGVKYQMYHALFLLFVGMTQIITLKEKTVLFYLVLVGVIFFSGSIYILTTSTITGIKSKIVGPITPIGGLFLILSWGYLFYAILMKK
mgnify:CR=1 FL=1